MIEGNVLHRVCVALEGPLKVTRFVVPYLDQTQNTCFFSIKKPLTCLAACYDKVKHKRQVWACGCYYIFSETSVMQPAFKHHQTSQMPPGYNLNISFRPYLPQERIVRTSSHINLTVSTALQAKKVWLNILTSCFPEIKFSSFSLSLKHFCEVRRVLSPCSPGCSSMINSLRA